MVINRKRKANGRERKETWSVSLSQWWEPTMEEMKSEPKKANRTVGSAPDRISILFIC